VKCFVFFSDSFSLTSCCTIVALLSLMVYPFQLDCGLRLNYQYVQAQGLVNCFVVGLQGSSIFKSHGYKNNCMSVETWFTRFCAF
jgi:hypothetical protein